MRRVHFEWTFLVTSIVLTVYGAYLLFYNFAQKKELSVVALIFLIVGLALLITYLVLFILKKKQEKQSANGQIIPKETTEPSVPPEEIEEPEIETLEQEADLEEPIEQEEEVGEPDEEDDQLDPYNNPFIIGYENPSRDANPSSNPNRNLGSGYVRKVGYGPIMEIRGEIIRDMRSNSYYRMEGNMVKKEGYGPVFEINGNRIRSTFGGYLYELSGSNINKVFGGFYASISGSMLSKYDNSERYEIPGRLNANQILTIAALIFGAY